MTKTLQDKRQDLAKMPQAEERIKNDPRFTFAKTPAEQSIFQQKSGDAEPLQEQNDQDQKQRKQAAMTTRERGDTSLGVHQR